MSIFSETLTRLGFANYNDYLASDHWRDFKLSYQDAGRSMRCAVCDYPRIQLHHHTYKRLGAERLDDVTPLCRSHHEAVHDWLKSSGKIFVEYTHEAINHLRGAVPAPVVETGLVAALKAEALTLAAKFRKFRKKRQCILNYARAGSADRLRSFIDTMRKQLAVPGYTPFYGKSGSDPDSPRGPTKKQLAQIAKRAAESAKRAALVAKLAAQLKPYHDELAQLLKDGRIRPTQYALAITTANIPHVQRVIAKAKRRPVGAFTSPPPGSKPKKPKKNPPPAKFRPRAATPFQSNAKAVPDGDAAGQKSRMRDILAARKKGVS